MTEPRQTVTLRFSSPRIPGIITRLTTYLVQNHYGFLQTRHNAEQTDFDISDQQNRPLIRLRLQATGASAVTVEMPSPPASSPLTADAVRLLHHLLQAENTS